MMIYLRQLYFLSYCGFVVYALFFPNMLSAENINYLPEEATEVCSLSDNVSVIGSAYNEQGDWVYCEYYSFDVSGNMLVSYVNKN